MVNKMKKADLDRKSKTVKDVGDVRKIEKYGASTSSPVTKINKNCDRGDPISRIGVEKVRLVEKKLVDVLPRHLEHTSAQSRENEGKQKDPLTKIAEMKRIKDYYTFRNKYSCLKRRNNECIHKDSAEKVEGEKNDCVVKQPNNEVEPPTPTDRGSPAKTPSKGSPTTDRRKMPSKTTLSPQVIRRPIIKTITSKNDKVYKAVNFVEKKVQPTQLQINIPTDLKKQKDTKTKPVVSKVSVKEKRRRDKDVIKKTVRPMESPDVTVKIRSPPTEVAKWTNVDHTKLYYEAWVDTTLAAISKKVKNKSIDKQKLLQSFQNALAERPISPEIDYNLLLDEKYTGKIKVNIS